jgi:hypothetical protein
MSVDITNILINKDQRKYNIDHLKATENLKSCFFDICLKFANSVVSIFQKSGWL